MVKAMIRREQQQSDAESSSSSSDSGCDENDGLQQQQTKKKQGTNGNKIGSVSLVPVTAVVKRGRVRKHHTIQRIMDDVEDGMAELKAGPIHGTSARRKDGVKAKVRQLMDKKAPLIQRAAVDRTVRETLNERDDEEIAASELRVERALEAEEKKRGTALSQVERVLLKKKLMPKRRIRANAVALLHDALEAYHVRMMQDALRYARHRGRSTVKRQDVELARYAIGTNL